MRHRLPRRPSPALPGQVVPRPDAVPSIAELIVYDPADVTRCAVHGLADLPPRALPGKVVWINVDGLGNAELVKSIGDRFGLHPLSLEDVMHTHQRAKVEVFENYEFVVVRMPTEAEFFESEQVAMFLGHGFVITFQERSGDCLQHVRNRIDTSAGRIRCQGADYLAYAILDAVIDSYFPVAERLSEKLDVLEEHVALGIGNVVDDIHETRNELRLVRKALRPHRETLNKLVRDASPFLADETRFFLRDVYDHTVQLNELLEIYRESCSDLAEYHLTLASNRMNEIMKVLTIISTIFIPLGFISGVYGMNFDTGLAGNMPELEMPYAYPIVLLGMLGLAVGMLTHFWRKGWFGSSMVTGNSASDGASP